MSTATAPEPTTGVRAVALRAQRAFGKDAVDVLRRWAREADPRYALAADLIEHEQAQEATSR